VAALAPPPLLTPGPRPPGVARRKDIQLTGFTPESALALDGPDWLRRRRAAAAEDFATTELPTAEDESWRYSRIDELDLTAFAPAAGPVAATPVPEAEAGAGPLDGRRDLEALFEVLPSRAATIVVRNGRVASVEVDESLGAKGFHVGPATDADADLVGSVVGRPVAQPAGADPDAVSAAAARADANAGAGSAGGRAVPGEATDPFVILNDAFMVEPVVVRVPPGVTVEAPVVVVHHTENGLVGGPRTAAFPRLCVAAGDDSEVTVVEVQVSDGAPSLVVPVTEIAVGRAARVGHVTLQQLGLATWQVALQVSQLEAESTLRTTSVGFGGDYARLRTDCRMVGRGATGELDAVYFGEATQTLDFRTFQTHVAPDCTSNLLYKGAGGGASRSVYTGLIRVGKEARGTNAFQTNRNIKLSDGAWAESIPNLVIENNDVRCSHASAVGPIDEEQRFYLESRGVPTDVAERLIVTGFFDEVLDRLPVRSLGPVLRAVVGDKFARRQEVDAVAGSLDATGSVS
jgi:Fe-S cluster assembly protein SufD